MDVGLILAAGAGTRFGSAVKQLALHRGRPLIEHAVAAQCAVGALERVVVVLGAHAEAIVAGADLLDAEVVVCEDWAAGQSATLRAGVRAVTGATRVVVTLGDQPGITPEAVMLVLASGGSGRPARAVYHGVPGHPVVLGGALVDAARTLDGDQGARGLLSDAVLVECGHLADGRDVDTPQDLENLAHAPRAVL